MRWPAVMCVTLAVLCAVPAAAQAVPYASESAYACNQQHYPLATSPDYLRNFNLVDKGQCGRIDPSEFVSGPIHDYYRGLGFDENFLYWAPVEVTEDPAVRDALWAGCDVAHPDGTICSSGIHWTYAPHDDFNGAATVKRAGASFIGMICGNINREGSRSGPVPTISGTKFEDANGNGARDGGEPGVGGVTIRLFRDGQQVATTTTAGDGGYSFALNADANPALSPGTYTLAEDTPDGWRQTRAPGALGVGTAIGGATFGGNDFGNQRLTDLRVTKTADESTVDAGTRIHWSIDVANVGRNDAPNSVLDDDLPAVAQDVTLPAECTQTGLHIHCTLGNIQPGETRHLRVSALIDPDTPAGTALVNTAHAGSDRPDANPPDNTDTVSTPSTAHADLHLTKTASRDLIQGGDPVTYTITATNNGPSSARAVTVTDDVPAEVAIDHVSPDQCTVSGRHVECVFDLVRPGASVVVTIAGHAVGSPVPADDPSHNDHLLSVEKYEQQLDLNAGETRTQTTSCPDGKLATDGGVRVDAVDQGTGTLADVHTLAQQSDGGRSYTFTVRNDAHGRAQAKTYVVCISAQTVDGSDHHHSLHVLAPVAVSDTLAPGRHTLHLTVPPDYLAIAPGYSIDSGSARLVGSEDTAHGWDLTFDVDSPAHVTASVVPLQRRLTTVNGHSHLLRFQHPAQTVTVPAHGAVEVQVACDDQYKGIVATENLPTGVTVTGSDAQPKIRVFKLANTTDAAAQATVDLLCVRERVSQPVDTIGAVINTAHVSSTTPDPNPGDETASVTIVIDRAVLR